MKIIKPVITDTAAAIRTPAAATSFALLIFSFCSSVIISERYSTAVLKHSLANTKPDTKIIASQSAAEILNKIPATITIIRMNRWILALCSYLSNVPIP